MNRSPSADTDLRSRQFERILIVKPSSLGDVVHALPVLHGLRQRYPNARIDWLIAPLFAPLVEGHADIDELVLFDRSRYGRMLRNPRACRDFVLFLQRLRRRRYDLVVDLQGLFRSGFLARATGAATRIGFRYAREMAWLFYNHRIPAIDGDEHAVDRNYRVSRLLGFEDVAVRFNLEIDDAARAGARAMLRHVGLDDARSVVAVVPGARWATKVWSRGRFANVIDRLEQESAARCVLLGSSGETELCGDIASQCAVVPADLSGRTSLREMAAIIASVGAVLCHDSGVMHIAVALERPLVCLMGPTNPARTGPYRRARDVVRVELDCAPCYLRKLSQCRHAHRCMEELSVDAVMTAMKTALHATIAPVEV